MHAQLGGKEDNDENDFQIDNQQVADLKLLGIWPPSWFFTDWFAFCFIGPFVEHTFLSFHNGNG